MQVVRRSNRTRKTKLSSDAVYFDDARITLRVGHSGTSPPLTQEEEDLLAQTNSKLRGTGSPQAAGPLMLQCDVCEQWSAATGQFECLSCSVQKQKRPRPDASDIQLVTAALLLFEQQGLRELDTNLEWPTLKQKRTPHAKSYSPDVAIAVWTN